MIRYPILLLLLLMAGCVSYVRMPDTIGVVVDAETGKPIRGATVTRASVEQSWNVPYGLPEVAVVTSRYGRFSFPTVRDSDFLLHFHETPAVFTPTFMIRAEGYQSTNVMGFASSNTLWRVDFGHIKLTRE